MMLEITGEYIPLDRRTPTPTRWQRALSWLTPVRVTVEDHGADWVRYLTFETTYVLRRGRWVERKRSSRLVATQDLRERNEALLRASNRRDGPA